MYVTFGDESVGRCADAVVVVTFELDGSEIATTLHGCLCEFASIGLNGNGFVLGLMILASQNCCIGSEKKERKIEVHVSSSWYKNKLMHFKNGKKKSYALKSLFEKP